MPIQNMGFVNSDSLELSCSARRVGKPWDLGFPLGITKSPQPENPGKLLKDYNLAHPGTVLKITEKCPPNY